VKTGEVHGHVRWCASCGHDHGILYACPSYPPEVLAEIAEMAEAWRAYIFDDGWCQATGAPEVVVAALRELIPPE